MNKNRRSWRRIGASLLACCLVLGLMGDVVPAATSYAGTEVTSSLTTLHVTDFPTDTSRTTAITEGTYTTSIGGAKLGSIFAGGNLGNTILDVDITFGGTGAKIQYAGCSTDRGLTLEANGENLEFYCTYNTTASGMQKNWAQTITPEKAGTALVGTSFNLKISIEFPNDTDAKIGLWFNDKLYQNSYITMEGMSSNVYGIQIAGDWNWFLGIHATEEAPITVRNPGEEPVGYTPVTLFDYGISDGTATSDVSGTAEEITSFDHKVITAQLSSETSYAYIRIGNTDWTGIELIWDASGNLLEHDVFTGGGNNYHTLILKNDMNSAPVTVAIYLDYVGTDAADLQAKYYVNGSYVTTLLYTGCAEKLGNYIVIHPVNSGSITYQSVGEQTVVTQKDESYEISDEGYLITGSNVTINGEKKTAGDTLTTPGDYQYISSNRKAYHKKIVLYKIGDVDLNGTAGEAADWTALAAIVAAGGTADTTAALKAADLNNDGTVDAKDENLAAKIQAGTRTLAEVKKEYYPAALSYDYLGGNEVMPIAGYFGPYRRIYGEDDTRNRDYLTDEVFSLVKDSGINLVTYAWRDWYESETDIKDMLSLAEKYGIGYYVGDAKLNTSYNFADPDSSSVATALTAAEAAAELSNYSFYQSALGIHVFDEPVPDDWSINNTSKKLKYFQDIASTLNGFVNTNGFLTMRPADSACFSTAIIGKDYSDFWDTYINETNPQVLAFDDYPFNDKASEGVTDATGYFESLSIVRKKALDNDLPFWSTVQAGGQFTESDSINEDLIASEPETYWNVNTSLAFGAKGIVWFTLMENPGFATDNTDKSGLLRTDSTTGETVKTKFYTWAQNANKQIEAADEVLMKATNKGVIAAGGTSSYAYTQTNGVTDSAVIDVTSTDHLTAVSVDNSTYGALVGCFDYKDSEAYYVVNYDVTENATQTVTVSFDDSWNYYTVADGTKSAAQTGSSATLTIPSGEAVLVVLESKETNDTEAFIDLAGDAAGYTIPAGATEITVNGETAEAGTILTEIGDYEVCYTLNGKEYKVNAVIYRTGDANLDGSTDLKDIVRMKKECQELTLSDVYHTSGEKISLGTVAKGSNVGGFFKGLDTLDEKAVTMKVTFPWTEQNYVRIGGKASNWFGLNICHTASSGSDALQFTWRGSDGEIVSSLPVYDSEVKSATGSTTYQSWGNMKLRLEFHKDGSDLAIGVYINNSFVKTLTYAGQADSLGAGFVVYAGDADVSIAGVTQQQALLKSMDLTGNSSIEEADRTALRKMLAGK